MRFFRDNDLIDYFFDEGDLHLGDILYKLEEPHSILYRVIDLEDDIVYLDKLLLDETKPITTTLDDISDNYIRIEPSGYITYELLMASVDNYNYPDVRVSYFKNNKGNLRLVQSGLLVTPMYTVYGGIANGTMYSEGDEYDPYMTYSPDYTVVPECGKVVSYYLGQSINDIYEVSSTCSIEDFVWNNVDEKKLIKSIEEIVDNGGDAIDFYAPLSLYNMMELNLLLMNILEAESNVLQTFLDDYTIMSDNRFKDESTIVDELTNYFGFGDGAYFVTEYTLDIDLDSIENKYVLAYDLERIQEGSGGGVYIIMDLSTN